MNPLKPILPALALIMLCLNPGISLPLSAQNDPPCCVDATCTFCWEVEECESLVPPDNDPANAVLGGTAVCGIDHPTGALCTSFAENNSNGGVCVASCNDPSACNYFEGSPNNDECEYTSCNPQTGTGIVFLSDADIGFPPTPQDSTSTIEVTLLNDVGAEQTVNFSGLEPPFDADPSSFTLAANADTTITFSFTPTGSGDFAISATASGNVFGEATLNLSGEGTLVELAWSGISVNAGTVALGSTGYAFDYLTNGGTGTASIQLVGDSTVGPFTLVSYPTSFANSISPNFNVEFNPVNAGGHYAAYQFATNDPANPTMVLLVNGVGISQVSGEICDQTWTASNSPYTLTGDVVVPEGCTLTLEPGVQVIGNNNDIEVFGGFFANGEEANEISIEVGELISHTTGDNMVINRTTLSETNEIAFTQAPYEVLINSNPYSDDSLWHWLNQSNFSTPYENESASIGRYFEDFNDNNCQGWHLTYDSWPCASSLSQTCNGNSYNRVYDNCSSNNWGWIRTLSPTFTMNSGEVPTNVSFVMDTYNINWGYNSSYIDYNIAYRINGGNWTNLENSGGYLQDATKSFDLSGISGVETIQFRMSGYFRYRGALTIDNFEFLTNYHTTTTTLTNQDLINESIATLSTGGITLTNSTYYGDFQSVNSYVDIYIDHSSILANEAVTKSSNGLGLYVLASNAEISKSNFTGHAFSGIEGHSLIGGAISFWGDSNSISNNGGDGIHMNGAFNFNSDSTEIIYNGQDGIEAGASSDLVLYGARIQHNGGRGIALLDGASLDLDYVLIDDNGGRGIDMTASGQLNADYLRICDSGEEGLVSGSPVNLNHSNIGFNTGTAMVLPGNNFHTVDNSILWGNNNLTYNQIDLQGGILSTSYSLIQGLSTYGVSGEGQYSLGEGLLEIDPLLEDEEMHLQVYSPCVDAGQPWQQDQHMPYGLGGVRADMGMYGGPANAYWGGEALPDGASTLSGVTDSPQDQGNTVGLTFTGSYYDNSELVNNVTHYAFWRHYDPTGQPVSTLDEGNWELLGTMPAQSFAGYAYQATTLGNTNDTGPFTSCYTVVAHTDDPDTYWYSNVLCGESVDNLAPMAPDLEGIVLEDGGAQLSWAPPTEEDYGYTMLSSDAGFFIELSTDTLVVDATVVGGNTYTYTAIHYDVNGNASPPSEVTLAVAAQRDVIPLSAGWNLISLDRTPLDAAVAAVMADLEPGNLLYVTGFDAGASFYDPAGLSFLNTLSSLEDGYGYWVKVAADDTLRVEGAALPAGTLPTLDAGWNLAAYTAEGAASPATVFADLLAADELVYVTGFDGGVSIYDPAGLPFLNSLVAMQNGFGYWVKTVADYAGMGLVDDGTVMGDAAGAVRANPAFSFLNGTSDLGDRPGAFVDVIGPDGAVVGRMEVLPGGLLMTAAVYGDDPTTEAVEGLSPGDVLHFALDGRLAAETAVWQGDMGHLKLDLHFDAGSGMAVFPNPVTDQATIQFELAEAGRVRLELLDATGRVVEVLLEADMAAGPQQLSLDAAALAPGVYSLSLRRGDADPMLTRIAIQ